MSQNQAEAGVLHGTCEKCGHFWYPFGKNRTPVPHRTVVKCPACGLEQEKSWSDSLSERKFKEKKLASTDIEKRLSDLEKRLALVEQSHSTQKQVVDIETKRRELVESDIAEIKKWVEKREKDFQEIEELAEEERGLDQYK